MKKTGFGVVTQGFVNRNVRSNKSTQKKSSYKKYTFKLHFQIAKYANDTAAVVLLYGNSNCCFVI